MLDIELPMNKVAKDTTTYLYHYDYTRTFDSQTNTWNPDNINRLDANNENVLLAYEIGRAFPTSKFRTYLGYRKLDTNGGYIPDPSIIRIEFEIELSSSEKSQLDTVISNHMNNVVSKYAVLFNNEFVRDTINPAQAYLFDTEAQANQYITTNGLNGSYAIWYENSYLMEISNPEKINLFVTKEAANLYISENNLTNAQTVYLQAVVRGVVVW